MSEVSKTNVFSKLMEIPEFRANVTKEALNKGIETIFSALGITDVPTDVMAILQYNDLDIIEIEAKMEEIYSNLFSVKELQVMYNFYATPEGRKIMTKLPQVQSALLPFLAEISDQKQKKLDQLL